MHIFANPNRFLAIAKPLTPWLGWAGAPPTAAALGAGLWLTPPDYLQGESVRIMYVHVPAAWLGMAGWGGIAAASLMQLVWRHPLAGVAAPAELYIHNHQGTGSGQWLKAAYEAAGAAKQLQTASEKMGPEKVVEWLFR